MADQFISGAVYALGNFDGVHRGHQALLAAARDEAVRQGLPVIALTFQPHPRRFFAPEQPPFLLTDLAQKERLLRQHGAVAMVMLTFNDALAMTAAEDFVRRILLEECGARAIVAGADFRFGNRRLGDMTQMAAWAGAVPVIAVPPVRDQLGERYATSAARMLAQHGQVQAIAEILGRPWALRGTVMRGDQRGRQLGFPTANIGLGDYQRPLYGVYVVRARRERDGLMARGVANIGRRPTVDGAQEWLEAHFFDFDQKIYGEVWEVELLQLLRPERKFSGLEALKAAIAEDCAKARTLLAKAS